MKELTQFERLNTVLKVFQPDTNKPATSFRDVDISNILKTSFEISDKEAKIIINQLPQILNQLIEDGYILFDSHRFERENKRYDNSAFKYYTITLNGINKNGKAYFEEPRLNPTQNPTPKKRSRIATVIQNIGIWIVSNIWQFILLTLSAVAAAYFIFKFKIPH